MHKNIDICTIDVYRDYKNNDSWGVDNENKWMIKIYVCMAHHTDGSCR